MKKIKYLLVLLILLSNFRTVRAEGEYIVSDQDGNVIGTYDSFYRANQTYNYYFEDYDNISIQKGDEYLKTKYGILLFKQNENCSYNIDYTDDFGNKGTINGCYVGDAAYLGGDENYSSFYLSGIEAEVSKEDTILLPLEQVDINISSFVNIDGTLYHQINTNYSNKYYNLMLNLGPAPEYLKDGPYYSYDTHYFYDDYRLMIDDLKRGRHDNPVNEEPYYNYFMYLPQRSLSAYSLEELNSFYLDKLKINSRIGHYIDSNNDYSSDIINESMMYHDLEPFMIGQYQYGVNALLTLGIANSQSNYGRQVNSYFGNNYFAHAAYIGQEDSKYHDLAESVYSHQKYYISNRYGNAYLYNYLGSYFGNLCSGMNRSYSNDPYFGERMVHYATEMDNFLGNKDLNNYCLGIVERCRNLRVYKDKELSDQLYKLDDIYNHAFILLSEGEDYYQIQLDSPDDREGFNYSFKESIGYINKQEISVIINPERMGQIEYQQVTLDGADGTYNGESQLEVIHFKGEEASMIRAVAEGKDFEKYNYDEEKDIYLAEYKDIQSIEVIDAPQNCFKGDYLDLDNVFIRIRYTDGTSTYRAVVMNMIEGFDNSKVGKQMVTVRYHSFTDSFQIEVSDSQEEANKQLSEYLSRIDELDFEDAMQFKKLLYEGTIRLTMDQIRKIDRILIENTKDKIAYVINSRKPLSVSGLSLVIPFNSGIVEKSFLKESVIIKTDEVPSMDYQRLETVVDANGYTIEDSIRIRLYADYRKIEPLTSFVACLKMDVDPQRIYTVFYLEEDGDVHRLETTQSAEGVHFKTERNGSYLIVSKPTSNEYELKSINENILVSDTNYSIGYMLILLIVLAGLLIITIVVLLIGMKKGLWWKDYKK